MGEGRNWGKLEKPLHSEPQVGLTRGGSLDTFQPSNLGPASCKCEMTRSCSLLAPVAEGTESLLWGVATHSPILFPTRVAKGAGVVPY